MILFSNIEIIKKAFDNQRLMTDLSKRIAEGSNLLADGQRFLLEQLRIGEEQLELLGKLAWLNADEKVKSCQYSPRSERFHNHTNFFSVYLKESLSIADFEKLLEKYDLPREHYIEGLGPVTGLAPWGRNELTVWFSPVDFDR